uniref:Uncharacterized protein n=1 Tax=Prymnesium polylepis TaxID=72548 RepID=A0A7S4IGN5_9EUKA
MRRTRSQACTGCAPRPHRRPAPSFGVRLRGRGRLPLGAVGVEEAAGVAALQVHAAELLGGLVGRGRRLRVGVGGALGAGVLAGGLDVEVVEEDGEEEEVRHIHG